MSNKTTLIPSSVDKFRHVEASVSTSSAVDMFSVPVELMMVVAKNPSAQAVEVRLYDKAASSVNPASDIPVEKWRVPSATTRTFYIWEGGSIFSTQCSLRVTQAGSDSGTTPPSSTVTVTLLSRTLS